MPRRPGAAAAIAAAQRAAISRAPGLPVVTKMPVTARDRVAALEVARERPWWPRRIETIPPVHEHGKWWFTVAG